MNAIPISEPVSAVTMERPMSSTSAVSWAAILAGATVAAATALTLSALVAGFGLASVSPWKSTGASAGTAAVMTAIGLIVVQWLSSSVGGYISGRLRTKWVGTHTHEVFFRDTAHGFLTWCLATLIIASALTSTGKSVLASTAQTAGAVASTAATSNSISPYDLDVLFRSSAGADLTGTRNSDSRTQVAQVLAHAVVTGDLPSADRTFVAQTVAAQTGISETDAQARVDQTIGQTKAAADKARAAADAARKTAELGLIFTALSMVIGAFVASISGALGGRLRDLHP
jgi:hypothetical protein